MFIVQGTGVPGQRQLHGAAVLDRRAEAGQRRVGDRGDAVLQLRQGRQEGRAAGLDPRAGSAPTPSRPPAPTGWSPSTCTRRRCRASSRCRSTTSTRCRCSATPSPRSGLTDLVVVAPDAGYAKKARQWANRLQRAARDRRQAAGRPHRVGRGGRAHRRGGGADRADRGRLHDHRRHAVDAARVLVERGATAVYAAVSHGAAGRPGDRAAGRQPDRAAVHHRQRGDPAGRRCPARSRSCRSPALFAEAIRRIADRESVSVLFQ